MTDEERRIITAFVERIAGVQPGGGGAWGGGSVPATQQRPPLPPIDPEADRLIADLFQRYPEARYRIAQFAFVTEAALIQAQNRIQELEWELENVRRQAQYAEARAQAARQGGGFLGGLFGGRAAAVPPPPPMPPRPQPVAPPPGAASAQMLQPSAMAGRSGPGFLGTALSTAAGVAGGMVLGNVLMNMLSGHGAAGAAHAASFGGAGAGAFAQEPVGAASPWTDPGQAAGLWGGQQTPGQDAAPPETAEDWVQEDAQPAGYDDVGGYDDAGGDEEI
ncbi:DUF2076 domain-containing protein [Caldovatus aquaticus]|uniref:DUF2076 domain-containing protein n=1 Tax=Caldovatus aquaticus TaxID=2865671 RepID=A0ABS7F5E5_9PROT|nr:DUF2076 domain-containing protein [Caldovatus aquaticus]MBW8270728.1 DUF2076 domain-containing protein [Caldovatus aquaticus]